MLVSRWGSTIVFDGNKFHSNLFDVTFDREPSNVKIKCDKNGSLWLATGYSIRYEILGIENTEVLGDGIFKLNKKTGTANQYKSELPDNFIYDFDIDESGVIWMSCCRYTINHSNIIYPELTTGSHFSGLTHFDGNNVDIIDTLNSPLPSNLVTNIAAAKDGTVWMSCMEINEKTLTTKYYNDEVKEYGLIKLNPDESWEFYDADIFDEMPSNRILEITVDEKNRPWIVFWFEENGKQRKLACLNNKELHDFDLILHLSSKFWTPKFDNNGNVWIAGYGELYKIKPNFETDTIQPDLAGLDGSIDIFEVDSNNNVWIYDGTNLAIYKDEEFGFKNDEEIKKHIISLHPNPFSQSTIINYELRKAGYISLELFDMLGNKIATLVDGWQEAGRHNYELLISNYELNAGMYMVRMSSGEGVVTEKVIRIE